MGLVHADFACELIHPLNKIPNISIAKKFRNTSCSFFQLLILKFFGSFLIFYFD